MFLPLEEEDGDDYADDEDNSQHGPNHPQKTFFLIHDRLRIHVRRGHWFGIRAGGVHCLEEGDVTLIFIYKLDTKVLRMVLTHVLREIQQRKHKEDILLSVL